MFFAVGFQIASITEFSGDKDIIAGAERINKSDDILVLDLWEDFDLRFDELLEFGDRFNLFFAESLDGKNLVIFCIDCFVDCPEWSTSELWEEVVLLDFFALEQLTIVSHEVEKQ